MKPKYAHIPLELQEQLMGALLRLAFFLITAGIGVFIILAIIGFILEILKHILPVVVVIAVGVGILSVIVLIFGFFKDLVLEVYDIFSSRSSEAGITVLTDNSGSTLSISNLSIVLIVAAVGLTVFFLIKKFMPVIDAFILRLAEEIKSMDQYKSKLNGGSDCQNTLKYSKDKSRR